MKYLLDTNTVSEVLRGNPTVVDRLDECARQDVAIAQPVIAEVEFGLAMMPRGKKRSVLLARWETLSQEFLRVAWTDAVSVAFGRIKASIQQRGESLEDMDIAIAAHAIAWDLRLVSGNLRHMDRIKGVVCEDWTAVR